MIGSHAIFGVSLLVITCAGCGTTVCDDALAKAESCGLQNLELNDSGDTCEDLAACRAECVNTGSCNDILEISDDSSATNDLAACLVECDE